MEPIRLLAQSERDEELRLEHRCRMGLLAVGILHWIVFYLLTQTVPPEVSGNVTRARRMYAQHAVQAVDAPGSASRQ
jgi:hypothetical protein